MAHNFKWEKRVLFVLIAAIAAVATFLQFTAIVRTSQSWWLLGLIGLALGAGAGIVTLVICVFNLPPVVSFGAGSGFLLGFLSKVLVQDELSRFLLFGVSEAIGAVVGILLFVVGCIMIVCLTLPDEYEMRGSTNY